MIRHMLTAGVQGIDHAAGIDRVPVNDGGDNQVEGGGPDREIFLAAIAEAAEAMAGTRLGRVTVRQARQGEAPRVRAASTARGSSRAHMVPTVRTTRP